MKGFAGSVYILDLIMLAALVTGGCGFIGEDAEGVSNAPVKADFGSPDPRGRIAAARQAAKDFGGAK
jgi:hypothetical protein